MTRRRTTRTKSSTRKPRPINHSEARIQKWNKLSDIPLDEEDEFHAARDKVLLDGEDNHGNDDSEEEEVFALKGVDEDEDGDEEEYDEEDEMDDEEFDEAASARFPSKKKSRKSTKTATSSSDESSEEEEESWGRSKAAYYSSNAGEIDSDDEEANELEEQEAKRLQGKIREDMLDADFGLEDILETEQQTDGENDLVDAVSISPSLPPDRASLLRHLEKNSPETLALARDWPHTVENLEKTRSAIPKIQSDRADPFILGMVQLHYQTLMTYATMLAYYLHLCSSDKYVQRPELLRSHPVLQRLLSLKQGLTTLEELNFGASDSDESTEGEDDMTLNFTSWKDDVGLDMDELEDLLRDAKSIAAGRNKKGKVRLDERPKKKRKITTETTESSSPSAPPVFDLMEPDFAPSKLSKSSPRLPHTITFVDSYGEATSLQHADAADKGARKKSLRFHTSKIESSSSRRKGARNQAMGGDDDLPYRERKKERDVRLVKEAAARVQLQGGADLDDTGPRPQKDVPDREETEDMESADGYYELVKRKSKEKKALKKADYDAAREAARMDYDEESVDGPRALTRAILTNKGLTPRRSKAARNPRVKKRQRFEKAKKKVASQKAVYKGGLSDTGHYEGEKSGISKVVKSVHLA